MATMKGCTYCGRTIPREATTCPHCKADNNLPVTAIGLAELTQELTPKQRALFEAEFDAVKKDGGTGVILSLLFGGLGAHHFYMGWWIVGLIYLAFCWTFIPLFLGVIEAFLMSGRVQTANLKTARLLVARIEAAAEASAGVDR